MKFFYRLPPAIVAVLLVFNSTAQTVQRNLLQSYVPQLSAELISRDTWKPFPQSPEGWRKLLPDSLRAGLIQAGEAALKFEFREVPVGLTLEFMRTGNRVHYEKASFEKRNRLWNLMLAESIEGKGRFTDKILEGIWSICEETYWGLPPHLGLQKAGTGLPDVEDPTVDLFTAETASVLAWVDYFAGPALEKISPLIRPRIYYEVNRRVLAPMVTQKYGYLGGGRTDVKLNNWAPWVMSNYAVAALLLEKDEPKRRQAVERAIHFTDLYIDGLGEDGGCEEGPTYWTAAGACVFDVLNVLHDATGGKIDIYRQPLIQRMGAYIYKMHIAGKYYVDIADAAPQLVPDGLMIYRFGEDMDDTVMKGFGSWIVHEYPNGAASYEQFHRTRTLYDMVAEGDCKQYAPAEPAVKDAWLGDIQVMVARNNGKELFVASHGGTNGESHNHDDVGDFIVYAGGKPVVIDVGSGTYTARTFSNHRYDIWFNTSAYHNLPVINGYRQPEGVQYKATDVQYRADRKSASLTMDIAKAYPVEAGIKSWRRVVSMDKAGMGGVTVTDRYEMKDPLKSLTQTFMTVCQVDLSQAGKLVFETADHKKVRLDYDPAAWSDALEKVDLGIPEEEAVHERWDNRPIYRVLMTAKKLSATGNIRWVVREE